MKFETIKSIPRDARFFLAASFMNSTGKAIMWPLTTLYVHNVLGKSYGEAGLIVLYQSLCGIIGEIVGGQLYYRIGPRRIVAGSFAAAALLLFGIAVTPLWEVYIVLICLLGVVNGLSMPSLNAYIGFRWRRHRRKLYNIMYVCNNFGLSIGALAGGLIASYSFSLTYLITGITTLGFSVYLFAFMRQGQPDEPDEVLHEPAPVPRETAGFLDSANANKLGLFRHFKIYLFVSVGSMFFWMSFSQWSTGVAPYITEKGMDLKYYSLLWTVNGLVILFGQPLTGWIKRAFAQEITKQMFVSACFSVTAFTYIYLFHDVYYHLVIGMILATLGEMLLLPAIPTFFSERTGRQSPFYMGLSGGFANAGRMIGPLLFGNAFDYWGISAVFLIGALSALLALLMFIVHSHLNREPENVEISPKIAANSGRR